MTANHASRRVLEKIGLNCVGTLRVDLPDPVAGSEDGEVEYELLRSGWNSGQLHFHALTPAGNSS